MQIRGQRFSGRRSPAGFTIIELMVTLVVGAVLLGIAVPSFRGYVQDGRLANESNTLVYSLNLARSEAVKRNGNVEVCASSNGTSCGGTWADGWIVLCTSGANCAAPTLLQGTGPIASGNTVSEQIGGATNLTFSSNGQTGQSYRFVFCDARGVSDAHDVEINLIGRVATAATAGHDVTGTALAGC